jgi:glutamate/tyrosine decarboxylase-like PLP-dependent enzyme
VPNTIFNELNKEFLTSNEQNFHYLLDKINYLHQQMPKGDFPKSKADFFNYEQSIQHFSIDQEGKTSEETLNVVANYFQGSIRPQSPYALFNMTPSPLFDTVAAATIAQLYNVNGLMDDFGGYTLLMEQKVARGIGRLAGFDQGYGISCNGGKLTLLYAIRAGIAKLSEQIKRSGNLKNIVVLTNESSHYCVEHVCSILGLGSDQCIRIPAKKDWQMDEQKLKKEIIQQTKQGKKIATIICCGGTTINFAHDDTEQVYQIVENTLNELNETYRPHLHLDSVIGWLWLAFSQQQYTFSTIEDVNERIQSIVKRQKGLHHFDSFGVDFHKNGLCPYSTSFFITASKETFNLLNDGLYKQSEKDFDYGNFRAYRYTIENSRAVTGIVSAFTSIERLGIEGLQEYLIQLQELRYLLKNKLDQQKQFKTINSYSLGWEVVFSIDFTNLKEITEATNDEIAQTFIMYCWNKCLNGEVFPLMSYVPAYRIHAQAKQEVAFLLYPINLESTTVVSQIVEKITQALSDFEQGVQTNSIQIEKRTIEKPIR